MSEPDVASMRRILSLVLSRENSPEERLRSLAALDGFLGDREAFEALAAHLQEEGSVDVRRAILSRLIDAQLPRAKADPAFRDCLSRMASFEAEASLRRIAFQGLARFVAADPEIERLLALSLTTELSAEIQLVSLNGLMSLPRVRPETAETVVAWAPDAPRCCDEPLLAFFEKLDLASAQRGCAALLTPQRPIELRTRSVERLMAMPRLDPAAAAILARRLMEEPQPSLWLRLLVLLCSVEGADIELIARSLEIMLARPELSSACALMQPYFDSRPELRARLASAYPSVPSSSVRMSLLAMMCEAGNPDLLSAGLKDENASVRRHAILLARRFINRYPKDIVAALARSLNGETNLALRRLILEALTARETTDAGLEEALLAGFAGENDPWMRAMSARLVLRIPPTPLNERELLNAYLSILDDPLMRREAYEPLLERLNSFRFSASAELREMILRLLHHTVDFDLFGKLFPLARAMCTDRKRLLSELIPALYRFIDYFPQDPLHDILRLMADSKASLPELQGAIPYIVQLTRASWLQDSIPEELRKGSIFEQILLEFNAADFPEMKKLIDRGFENRVLKKSDLIRLYISALAHPELGKALDAIVPILREAGVIAPEIVQQSLAFLVRYPVNGSAMHCVERYLSDFGPTIPGYLESVKGAITGDNYRHFALMRYKSADQWPLLDLVPAGELFGLLRSLLREPLDPRGGAVAPPEHLIQNAALARLRRNFDSDPEDMEALAAYWTHVSDAGGNEGLAGPALIALVEKWHRVWAEKEPQDLSSDALRAGTDAFRLQLERWLELGGISYPERVKPMPGIDMDRLRTSWRLPLEKWQEMLQAYLSLLAPEGIQGIPHAPGDRRVPPPELTTLTKSVAGIFELLKFLVLTPPPTEHYARDREVWRRMAMLAQENYPKVLAGVMKLATEPTRKSFLMIL
jgi:hypothetical protein